MIHLIRGLGCTSPVAEVTVYESRTNQILRGGSREIFFTKVWGVDKFLWRGGTCFRQKRRHKKGIQGKGEGRNTLQRESLKQFLPKVRENEAH